MVKSLNVGDVVKLPSAFKDRKHYRVVGWTKPAGQTETLVTLLVPNAQKSDIANRTIQYTKLLKRVK